MMKRRRRGSDITMTIQEPQFWAGKGRYSKSGMLKALKDQEKVGGTICEAGEPCQVVPSTQEGDARA